MNAPSRSRREGRGRGARVLRFVSRLPARPADLDPLREADRPGPAFERAWRDGLRRRTVVVLSLIGLWAVGVEARLVNLQVLQHGAMLEMATNEEEKVVYPVGVRGDIVDRHGDILAYSVPAPSIIATPKDIKDPIATVTALCAAFGDCQPAERTVWLSQLSSTKPFAYVRRSNSVSPAQADRIARLKLRGVTLYPDTQRYYPKVELAAHVLGFVGEDNRGLGGIEYAYDDAIRGEAGTVRVEVDARGRGLETRVERAPTTGATVELSIDAYIQHIAERELAAGVEARHADGGTVVVMDPHTGEILALANVPTFNPNAIAKYPAVARLNRGVQDVYEPGSTFKIVTASAALQENVFSTTDLIDTAPGYIMIGSRKIADAEGHDYGVLSFEDVIVKSSNVGASKIGLRVGPELMERYVHRFGFGEVLLPDLRGATPGRVYGVSELNTSALASMSMGYQVSVTPVQMATAVSAVANGGTLYQPRLVRAFIRDGVRQPVAPKALRQAITPETAATMTSIMEEVVHRGTGTEAAPVGYQAAGKTGTAEKLVNHVYSTTAYNASFVGFVPSRNPVLTIVVVMDTPRVGGYFGGLVSAPIFKRVAEAALRHLGIPPSTAVETPVVPAPAETTPAASATPATAAAGPEPIFLAPGAHPQPRMPDVRGLTAREARRLIDAAGLEVRVIGEGVVTSQTPQAGDPVEPGTVGTIHLGVPPAADARTPVGGGRP